jgi:mannose-6-phosphate isomerase-like protein (cupin superfamily)
MSRVDFYQGFSAPAEVGETTNSTCEKATTYSGENLFNNFNSKWFMVLFWMVRHFASKICQAGSRRALDDRHKSLSTVGRDSIRSATRNMLLQR